MPYKHRAGCASGGTGGRLRQQEQAIEHPLNAQEWVYLITTVMNQGWTYKLLPIPYDIPYKQLGMGLYQQLGVLETLRDDPSTLTERPTCRV